MSVFDDQQIPFAEDLLPPADQPGRPTSGALHQDHRGPDVHGHRGRLGRDAGGRRLRLADSEERIIINMGPQHPSTHGVLRLILELEGETVVQARSVIGYLHTGIEKSCEFRTWTQAVTFLTRADYLSPAFNEAVYCMGVERLLGIEVPQRAQVIRVLLMELTRMTSHFVAIATNGMELGALTGMTAGFREREEGLHLMEFITGLRMNMAFIRPGGVAQDLPEGTLERIDGYIEVMNERLPEYDKLLTGQPIWKARMEGVGILPLEACMQLGITGPVLRRAGLPWDLRKTKPYCGYETYDFEVPTATEARLLRQVPPAACRNARIAQDHEAVPGPAGRARSGDGPGRRRSPGRRSCRSARTAWAIRWSTSARSWASRWSR